MTFPHVIAFVLAALVGFACHRASLCTVRAVTELMESGSAHMLLGFGRAVLWAAAVIGTFALLRPDSVMSPPATASPPLALAGGLLFGVGAAINGGCSLSTLQRLVDGESAMLATLSALMLGMYAVGMLDRQHMADMLQMPSFWQTGGGRSGVVVAALAIWCAIEAARLLRPGSNAPALRSRLLSPTYRPASSAALMGLAAGSLYLSQGAWTYTSFLRGEVGSWLAGMQSPSPFHALLVFALVGGMLGSSLQRRSFQPRRPSSATLTRAVLGGFLMGIGAALIPGGNDALLLSAIPALAPWALATYLSLLVGVAITLVTMRHFSRLLPGLR